MNNKTFTNSLKSKILKYLLSIKNENKIRHCQKFKHLYLLSKLIILINFNILVDFIEYNIRCIIFFHISKRKIYFISIDKNENVKLHKIMMTFSMIYDSSFVIIRT